MDVINNDYYVDCSAHYGNNIINTGIAFNCFSCFTVQTIL